MLNGTDPTLAHVTAITRRMGPELRRQWVRGVLSSPDLTAAQKTVMVALETFADYGDGTNAHPGETNLAEICGLTTRAVRAALARARDLGIIERTAAENPRAGLAAVYRLVFAEPTTGTAVPVKPPTTGTAVPVNNPTTGTATSPSPEQPFRPPRPTPNQLGVLRNWGTSPAPANGGTHTDEIPSRFCDRHPHGTRGDCGPCGNARMAYAAWQAEQSALDVTLAQSAQRQRHELRVNCPWCEGTNTRERADGSVEKCDHTTPPQSRHSLSLVPPLPSGRENVWAAQ